MEQVKEWYDRQSWMSLTFYSTSAASLVLSAGAYALRRRNTRAMYEKVRPLFVDFSSPINFNPTRGVTLSSIGQAEKISYYDIHRSIRFAATDDKYVSQYDHSNTNTKLALRARTQDSGYRRAHRKKHDDELGTDE